MNIFVPVMRHTSPSRTARVRIAATSEPASGSVMAIAPIFSPAIAGRSQRSRCSSEPNWASAGVAMSVCTEIAIAMPGRTGPRQLLDEDDARGEVAVASAPARRIVEAEEAELAAAAEQLVGKVTGRLPLVDERPDLGVDEPADGGAELVVLGREDGVARVGHRGYNAVTSRRPAVDSRTHVPDPARSAV